MADAHAHAPRPRRAASLRAAHPVDYFVDDLPRDDHKPQETRPKKGWVRS